MNITQQKRKNIGKSLSNKREESGLTRYSVSKDADGLSITQIKSIDKSTRNYTVDSLIEYATAMGGEVVVKFK